MSSLAERTCVPCRKGMPALESGRARELLGQLEKGWTLNAQGHLERMFAFKDFKGALEFANRVGAIAEAEDHHPELLVGWGHCRVELWTHAVSGLSENDFVLAAKCERVSLM